MKHELPALPYAENALEPHISRETLQYHHGKHHRTYVNKLNDLIRDGKFANASLQDIILHATDDIFNNAAQVWNHTFYWQCLSPAGGGNPTGEFGRVITSAFGSFDAFKKEFSHVAETTFGSGWAWLVRNTDGSLEITSTHNADTPMRSGQVALLTCDVWEHAYYIDYRNARPDYVKAFWNLVNWEFVAQNLVNAQHESRSLSEA
jgi:Fe-Mn family superoxide dismutase